MNVGINVRSELDKTVEVTVCEALLFVRASIGLLQGVIHVYPSKGIFTLERNAHSMRSECHIGTFYTQCAFKWIELNSLPEVV